jgi:adenosylhomocysteine nucleosidase
MRNIVVIAAMKEEADALYAGRGAQSHVGYLTVRSVALPRVAVHIAQSGMGKVNTAAAAALLIPHFGAELIALTGTCGMIGQRTENCFWIKDAVQSDYGAERPGHFEHYTAGDLPLGPAKVAPFTAMKDPGLGLPHARMASGDAFVECPVEARFLSDGLSADVVDMEAGALGQIAAMMGVPWAGIKATTDDCNTSSVDSFHTNLVTASERAAAAMERFLEKL